MRNNRLLEMHAAEAQLVGMGRIVGGIASIVSLFFLLLFFYPAVRACWREGGGDASGTEGEGEGGDVMINIEYRIDNNNVVEGERERERERKDKNLLSRQDKACMRTLPPMSFRLIVCCVLCFLY